MVTRSESKFNTLEDVLGQLRSKPGSLSFGHNGTGSNGQLALVALSSVAGVEVNPVPFKGTAAQKTDLLGGHLDFGLISAGEVPELHGGKAGQLKVITQFSEKRSAALPQSPTASEGKVEILMSSERGLAAPKAVPDEILGKLQAAVDAALRDPEFAASAGGDGPVLAFAPGPQWEESLKQNSKLLQEVAAKAPKE
jgi:tripartite-type tricarboxylate transporter receptor subunit TctC